MPLALPTVSDPEVQQALDVIATELGRLGAHERSGTGTPEGNVVGHVGDRFRRTDGGATTSLYVKTSGAGTNTGWTAK